MCKTKESKCWFENIVSFQDEASRKKSLSGRDWIKLIPRNQELWEFATFALGTCGNFGKFCRICRTRHSLAKCHQPMIVFLRYRKASCGDALANPSARWCCVSTFSTAIVLSKTHWQKWWSWTAKCLVRGRDLWVFADSRAPTLSSNTLQIVLGWDAVGKSHSHSESTHFSCFRVFRAISWLKPVGSDKLNWFGCN